MPINNPYSNTPYDVFSFPNDPEIGCVGPASTQEQIKTQHGRILRRRLRDPRQAVEAMDRLRGTNRLAVDIFLVSTFEPGGDLDKLSERFKVVEPPQTQAMQTSLPEELDYWREIPELGQVAFSTIEIARSSDYDDPLSDLINVDFDR